MKDCPNAELRDLLPDYAGGRLVGAERAAVERHVAACADCTAELALLRAAGRALGETPFVNVARIVAALPPAPALPSQPGVTPIASRRPRGAYGAWGRRAAAIAAVVVGAVGVTLVRFADDRPTPRPVAVRDGAAASSPSESGARNAPALAPEAAVLTMAGGVGDLSDEELRDLLGELETIDDGTAFELDGAAVPAASGIEEDTT